MVRSGVKHSLTPSVITTASETSEQGPKGKPKTGPDGQTEPVRVAVTAREIAITRTATSIVRRVEATAMRGLMLSSQSRRPNE